MDMLEAFSVNYFLDSEQIERLKNIKAASDKLTNKKGSLIKSETTISGIFNTMMQAGSKYLINDRLINQEELLGIIDHEEAERRRANNTPKPANIEMIEI